MFALGSLLLAMMMMLNGVDLVQFGWEHYTDGVAAVLSGINIFTITVKPPDGTDMISTSVTAASSSRDLGSTEEIAEAYWVAVGVLLSLSSLLYHVLARYIHKRLAVAFLEIVTLAEVCCRVTGCFEDELSHGVVSYDHQADNKE